MYYFRDHRQASQALRQGIFRLGKIVNAWIGRMAVVVLCALAASCDSGEGNGEEGSSAKGDAGADSTLADSAGTDSLDRIAPAIPVETSAAVRAPISSHLLFSSTIETEAAVEIHSRLSGHLVRAIRAEEGDRVEAGDTLVLIDDDELRVAARESEVNLSHLSGGFERMEEMFRRKLISDQEYEDKRFALEQARLRHQKARMELEHAVIRAPFSGVITERHVQVGASTTSGKKLFALVKLDAMIARVFVPGQYLTSVRAGQVAVITSEFLEGRSFEGRVKRISPVVDPKSGTFKVTVGVRDHWEYLRPGIFVKVRIITDTHENAVLVPKEAVIYEGGDKFIYLVEDSTAARIRLDAGFENSEYIEALSAVRPGTPVIVVGQTGLKDGARVRIVHAGSSQE